MPRQSKFLKPEDSVKFRINWLLLAIGILFVALAAILEHPVVDAVTPEKVAISHTSAVFSWKAVIGLIKEVGFALIIAWAVSYLIESQAKKREHEAHEAARKQMASDVVHAVFGLQHSPAYVRKVVEQTLQPRVIRTHYTVGYTIERLSPDEEARLGVSSRRFVKLTQISSYAFKNVSGETVLHPIKYAMPVRAGSLYDFAGIVKARIGSQEYEGDTLSDQLKSDRSDVYKAYEWERSLKPGREIEIVVEAVSIKELSDTEVWGNYHATYEGMIMSVRNEVPEIVHFGIRALTATDYEQVYQTPGKDAQWKIVGPILPNDSVVFWWRSSEDDGLVASSSRPASQDEAADTQRA